MKKIGGSTIVAKSLKKEGVDTLFTLPGGHTIGLYYACNEVGIKVIDCRSEYAVVAAAIGYARTTGKPGILCTTAGPGVSNTVTGMLEAFTSHTPLVHIGGAAQLIEEGTGALQDEDTLAVMRSCSKWAEKVTSIGSITTRLDTAFRYALSGLPGPTYVEIPCDILLGCTDHEPQYSLPCAQPLPAGNKKDIEQAAKLLAEATAPCIIVGNFANYGRECDEYIGRLAKYLSAPIQCGTLARGQFIDEYDLLAKLGAVAPATADVILTLGVYNDCSFGKLLPPAYNADAKYIQVLTDASLIGMNQNAHIGIVGSSGLVAKQLYDEVLKYGMPKSNTNRFDELEELVKKSEEYDRTVALAPCSEKNKVRPGRCAWETVKFLETKEGREYTIVADGGDGGAWMNMLAKAHTDRRLLGIVGNGTIGLASGIAVGAWFGEKKKLLIYTGDGSFGFMCMEFHSFVKYKIPAVVVISNDSAWGMVKGFEYIDRPDVYNCFEEKYYDSLAVNLNFVHYEKLAEMFGGYGELVEKAEDIVPAIQRGIASGKPAIINVRVEDISKDGYSRRTKGMAEAFKMYLRDF